MLNHMVAKDIQKKQNKWCSKHLKKKILII